MSDDNSDNFIPFILKKEEDESTETSGNTPRAMALILASQHADYFGLTDRARTLFVAAMCTKYIETAKQLGEAIDWPEQAIRIMEEMEDGI